MRLQVIRFFLLGFFFFSCVLTALPFPVSAAGLIPCGRTGADATAEEKAPCTICHVVIGGNRIIEYGLKIMTVTAIAVIVAMAIFYIISTGDEGMMSTAKGGIKAALIGFAVMLGAWLIVNTTLRIFSVTLPGLDIKPTGFSFTCDATSLTGTGVGGAVIGATGGTIPAGGPLPVGCDTYQNAFVTASTAFGVPIKLLKSIASAESGCNPNKTSPAGSCGLMQLTPTTVGSSCQDLINNPQNSIQLAANYLKTLQGNLNAYKGTFDIGNNFELSGSVVTVQSTSYDGGNDDLIASYNAGSGSQPNIGGQKGPFMVSSDCPPAVGGGKSIPAWQCPVNPGGFGETQIYVQKVQGYMKQ